MANATVSSSTNLAEIAAIRARREALYQAVIGLEDALASPTADAERWLLRVAMAVDHGAARITDHIDKTESPGGLLPKIKAEEPRLTRKVTQLQVDHERLAKSVDALGQAVAAVEAGELSFKVEQIRNQAVDLLGQLIRHRQRGSDLIYEAFNVDLGQSS